MIDSLIRTHGKRLYGFCMTLCKNTSDADDLYQDTWLKVIDNIGKYDTSKPFEPWLIHICANIYRNRIRRISHSPFFDSFSSNEEKDTIIENIPVASQADYSGLHAAINRLPEKLRLCVILYYFQDMDIPSTARILSIPEGTVKSRLNKARKKLKEDLPDETAI
ncbi:MAG: sigma-70 family RNA polymerase sigma factor [Lachnospiraceae bacterium]|nr:sigma-70 family RNA polymerase sigma factor [Lachnospiraceae bacterium]